MLIYNKKIFSKYIYIYNIYLYTCSKTFILSKISNYIFYFWLITIFKKTNILRYLVNVFYSNPVYFYISQINSTYKKYSNSFKTCSLAAKGLIGLRKNIKNYALTNTPSIHIKKKLQFKKKEYYVLFKFKIFNFLKFKDVFLLFLFIIPLFLLNIHESWSVNFNFNYKLYNKHYNLIPYLQEKYFFFNYYI